MWKRRWRDRLGGCPERDEGTSRRIFALGQVNSSVSLPDLTTN